MASGCIFGICRYCDESVYEDEDYEFSSDMEAYHAKCMFKLPYNQILEREITRLNLEIKGLKKLKSIK